MCIHLLDLRHPVPNGVERLFVCHIINKEDSLRASEIRGGDGAEAFLPSGVPDLQLDSLCVAARRHNKKVRQKGVHGCDPASTTRVEGVFISLNVAMPRDRGPGIKCEPRSRRKTISITATLSARRRIHQGMEKEYTMKRNKPINIAPKTEGAKKYRVGLPKGWNACGSIRGTSSALGL